MSLDVTRSEYVAMKLAMEYTSSRICVLEARMDNHHFYLRWVLQHPYGVEVGGQTTMSDDMLLVHVADYVLGAVREEFAAMHDQVDPWPDHFHLLFKPPEGWPDYYPPENMG